MIFRRAAMADMDDVMRAVGEAQAFMKAQGLDQWQDGYPEREILERDIALDQLYVIEDEGRVAAFAALSLQPEAAYEDIDGAWAIPGKYLTIHRMAMDDEHRGRGLAGEILARAVEIARAQGCAAIRADTHADNRAMRRFLERHGFEYRGIVRYDVHAGDPFRVAYERGV